MTSPSQPFGVFVGRLNPIHNGHERVIRRMLKDCGPERSLVVIGSCNTPMSLRHFFPYETRRELVKLLFPDVRVIGVPDYQTDREWLLALDDLLAASGLPPKHVTFYGGSQEDVRFFLEDGRTVIELNRFDGTGSKMSATEVRDALIHDRPLDGMVNPAIIDKLLRAFRSRWDEFARR